MAGIINPYRYAAGGSTFRYTKLTMTANHGDISAFAMTRLEAYTSVGGSDVLAGSGATLTASSTFAGTSVNNLTDGNDSTLWSSTDTTTQTIIIDWGATHAEIVEIGMRPRDDGNPNFQQFPLTGSVSFSDDNVSYSGGWSFSKTGIDGSNSMIRVRNTSLLVPGAGSTRRIWGIKFNTIGAGQTIPHCNKIEFRASAGGATYISGGTALSATKFSTSFSPNNAATGTGDFAMKNVSLGYWFYDFGEGNEKAKPAEIMLKATSTDPTRMPSDFDLIYSDGQGGPITVQQNFTSPGAWSANEVRTFTVT